jgi:hypothetical protein
MTREHGKEIALGVRGYRYNTLSRHYDYLIGARSYAIRDWTWGGEGGYLQHAIWHVRERPTQRFIAGCMDGRTATLVMQAHDNSKEVA